MSGYCSARWSHVVDPLPSHSKDYKEGLYSYMARQWSWGHSEIMLGLVGAISAF